MLNNCQRATCLSLIAVLTTHASLRAEDWEQWRGPQRDGVWRETGIRDDIPSDGLPERWRVPVALGYAGPAVADGKVYLFEYEKEQGELKNSPGGRPKLDGVERLRCLSSASGEELWRYEYDRNYKISYPSGPRCTPTVDGDRVYALGAEGDLTCLRTGDGSLVWKKSFQTDYGVKTPIWGHSAHPLVDGDTLYCVVGGDGSIAVAFDKLTGEERWRALSAGEPGYCPPTMLEIAGKQQLVIFYPLAVCGLDPTSGQVQWSIPIEPSYGMSIAQPMITGDRIFTSGYNASVCFSLPNGSSDPDVYWAGKPKTSVSSANVTPIYDGSLIYGVDANDSVLAAVDPSTGERVWQTKAPTVGEGQRGRHGTVFIVRQGNSDRYWLFSELGDLILAKLTAAGYEELGRQKLLEPTGEAFGRSVVWSHPAFAEQAVFVRNDEQLVCVELSSSR
ncbi:MAG: PQQ-binding-like beta-propeller repeat protein [Planctomycetota bacterium]